LTLSWQKAAFCPGVGGVNEIVNAAAFTVAAASLPQQLSNQTTEQLRNNNGLVREVTTTCQLLEVWCKRI